MKEIFIDIETYSDIDLSKCGVYRYAQSINFEVLLFSYSIDQGPVKVVDLKSGEKISEVIVKALTDNSVKKYAYNAVFERVCLSKHLGYPIGHYLSPDGWFCDMVHAATLVLPLSLENVGTVLGIEKMKLSTGKNLIKYFCVPCSPTKTNGMRTRNLPHHDKEKWEEFKEYNIRDVETEIEIHNRLIKFPVLDSEWNNYHLDQRINDYGIMLDMEFVNQAIRCSEENEEMKVERAKVITGVNNPNSPKQLKEWILEQGIQGVDSLSKADVQRLLKDATGNVEEILKLRQEIAKSSIKKYQAMQNVVCKDSRARGLIQFYGANRTGRFAGRLIQVQNLPQNHLEPIDEARQLIRNEDIDAIMAKFGTVSSVLSELIRTAFIPKPGSRFIVADYSSIEARVLAWYAQEKWRLELFEKGGDIYCQSASLMFGVPVEKKWH
jgi:phage related DNA polymerase